MSDNGNSGCGEGCGNIGCWIATSGIGAFILVIILGGLFAQGAWETGEMYADQVRTEEISQTATEAGGAIGGLVVVGGIFVGLGLFAAKVIFTIKE
jgi:hypothetical protein